MRKLLQATSEILWAVAMALAAAVVGMAFFYGGRSQETAVQVLMSQGDTLIRVLEAGARMGHGGPALFGLARVMDEMVGRRDVEAVAVLGPELRPMAISLRSPRSLDGLDFGSLRPEIIPQFRLVEAGDGAHFVVYRRFRPTRPFSPVEHPKCAETDCALLTAVVVLDGTKYVAAGRRDRHVRMVALGMGGLLLLVGSIGLFWRQRARSLQDAMARQAQLAAVGNLAAGVAHEIRNPLSSIKGFATYFTGLFPEDSREAHMARLVVEEVGRIDRSVSDLLHLARPFQLQPTPLDAGDVCQDTLYLVEEECRAKGIVVETDIPAGISVVWDGDRIRQMLLNVLRNAIQAMPQGGRLGMRLRKIREGVELAVQDTGEGIAPEHLGRIFDPYFTTRGAGTGLGLAVTRRIVEAHGGRIDVTSSLGVGTVVQILLPMYIQGESSGDAENSHRGR